MKQILINEISIEELGTKIEKLLFKIDELFLKVEDVIENNQKRNQVPVIKIRSTYLTRIEVAELLNISLPSLLVYTKKAYFSVIGK
ncbi:MAG TPA: hypothetical protein VMU83_23785 [Hanamia sp.]|nr:hypothetical protein [Hanamia sp.]